MLKIQTKSQKQEQPRKLVGCSMPMSEQAEDIKQTLIKLTPAYDKTIVVFWRRQLLEGLSCLQAYGLTVLWSEWQTLSETTPSC